MLRFLNEEWEVIRGAPRLFVAAILVVTVVLVGVFKFFYDRELGALRAENELSQARISGLETELRRKEDRLSGTEYPKENKAQLQHQALELVSQIRDFIEKAVQSSETGFLGHVATATSNVLGNPVELPVRQALLYERNFKTKAKVLRDRILYQLPLSARDDQAIPQYEKLTIPALRGVADDLERLARRLNGSAH